MCTSKSEREKFIVHASRGRVGAARVPWRGPEGVWLRASSRWVGWGIHLTGIFICEDYKAGKTIQLTVSPRGRRQGSVPLRAGGLVEAGRGLQGAVPGGDTGPSKFCLELGVGRGGPNELTGCGCLET